MERETISNGVAGNVVSVSQSRTREQRPRTCHSRKVNLFEACCRKLLPSTAAQIRLARTACASLFPAGEFGCCIFGGFRVHIAIREAAADLDGIDSQLT